MVILYTEPLELYLGFLGDIIKILDLFLEIDRRAYIPFVENPSDEDIFIFGSGIDTSLYSMNLIRQMYDFSFLKISKDSKSDGDSYYGHQKSERYIPRIFTRSYFLNHRISAFRWLWRTIHWLRKDIWGLHKNNLYIG